jgi:hypothetical protein
MLQLENASGSLEMLEVPGSDIDALTEAAGAHPLFNGVKRAAIAGLTDPEASADGDRVTIRAPGLTATFEPASLSRGEGEMVVRLRRRG